MALDISGFEPRIDWPRLGPALLIASAFIVAIRTARWHPPECWTTGRPELDREIEYGVRLAGSILDKLAAHHPGLFSQTKQPWYRPNDDDVPK